MKIPEQCTKCKHAKEDESPYCGLTCRNLKVKDSVAEVDCVNFSETKE